MRLFPCRFAGQCESDSPRSYRPMRLNSELVRPSASLPSTSQSKSPAAAPKAAPSARSMDSFTPAPARTAASTAPAAAMAATSLASAQSATVHTVQPGDTLWGISQKYGTTVQSLRDLNPAIRNTDFIPPGQQLVVSGGSGTGGTPGSGGTRSYTIQPGDTMGGIAARNSTTVNELMRLNPWITNPDRIQAGWTIQVPSGGTGGPTIPGGP